MSNSQNGHMFSLAKNIIGGAGGVFADKKSMRKMFEIVFCFIYFGRRGNRELWKEDLIENVRRASS